MSAILWILFWIVLVSAAIAGVSAAPWLPTRKKELNQLLGTLRIHSPHNVIDLGCGDGRVLFAISKEFPDAICHGVEISVLPYLAAILRKWMFYRAYRHVHIHFKSLYAINLNSYDTIITFLLDGSYGKLQEKWAHELNDGARVYVQAWPLKEVQEEVQVKQDGILPLYVYRAQDLRK